MQKIRRALRMRGCREDRALIVLHNFKPRRKIGRVILAGLRRDAKVGAKKRRSQLGDEFFRRIACVAPALAPELPVEARLVARPVRVMPISA